MLEALGRFDVEIPRVGGVFVLVKDVQTQGVRKEGVVAHRIEQVTAVMVAVKVALGVVAHQSREGEHDPMEAMIAYGSVSKARAAGHKPTSVTIEAAECLLVKAKQQPRAGADGGARGGVF